MAVWKLLGFDPKSLIAAGREPTAVKAETETVRKIVQAMDQMEPAQARYIAAFAYLLSRVAYADHKVSPEETQMMEQIVIQRGQLPEEQAILIVQMAKSQSVLFSGTENFLVTREFGTIASREQKLALLDCLYAVCAADRSISTIEDNEIRNISIELKLSHDDFIAVRMKYREYLAVLKK
jgi:uncharacterized tellurite resistance protein B-like protein